MHLAALVLVMSCWSGWSPGEGSRPGAEPLASARPEGGRLRWMENRGQWPEAYAFVAMGPGATVGVTRDGIVVERDDAGRLERTDLLFPGASTDVVAEGFDVEPGLHHYYRGSNPSGWVRNVRWYGGVRLRGVHPGIDLDLRWEEGRLEYDLHVAEGADPSSVVVHREGSRAVSLHDPGGVLLDLDGHLDAGPQSSSAPGVSKPALLWATYWGGHSSLGIEGAYDAAVDAQGNVTVVGEVEGFGSFQTETTFQSPFFGSNDAFVAKFRQRDGRLVYSSRIGGEDHESALDVAVDSQGRAYVVGKTGQISFAFPTTAGAFDTTLTGAAGFVLRLSPLGDDLEYSTLLDGAPGRTEVHGVAIANTGAAVVTGFTSANGVPAFPTTPGSFDPTFNGLDDIFVTRLDPTGSFLEWSTFLGGGSGFDLAFDLALGEDESVYVTGKESSVEFPTTPNAFQTTPKFLAEAFVTRLAADGSSLVWSTLVSGFGMDIAQSIAVTPEGHAAICGTTNSVDFPTTPGALQETKDGFEDAFVTVLDASGSRLRYSTFLGGPFNGDTARAIVIDASGIVTVTGDGSVPLTMGAFQTSGAGPFVSRFDPSGSRVLYSTLLGLPSSIGTLHGIDRSPEGRITVVGRTQAPFPTTPHALFPDPIGGTETTIATFDLLLEGVSSIGTSQPSCLGPLNMNATEMPRAGEPFGVYCSQAPPLGRGFLLVSPATLAGEGISGALSWLRPVQADADGFVETRLGTLVIPRGSAFRCRYVFFDSGSCASSASWGNGLLVRVQ